MSTGPASAIVSRGAPRSLREAWVALAGLSAVFLFEMLDNSILNVALPTIGRDLHASTTALQWVTGAYAVVFGGLMLAFGAVADRFGRRRIMLIGLVLLGRASLATAFVSTAEQLIAVRVAMGVAAAMTTPGSMALAFRLFDDDGLRVRAMTLISTVGLVGLAIGPTVGGLVLAVAPWPVLLLINVPVAVLAMIGVRPGIAADAAGDLHRDPVDVAGAGLGTATIVLALVAPTAVRQRGRRVVAAVAGRPAAAVAAAVLFVLRERSARHPLLDLELVAHPLVSSGLAFKAAAGLATAGLGYLVTLQLQLDWGWSPALAAVGMLPQVVVLVAGGAFVGPFVRRVGLERAAWISSVAVVLGLAVYGLLGNFGYLWVALALVLVAAGHAGGRRRRRDQRAARPAREPDHDRGGAGRHRHRGRHRRRHRRHRHASWPRCSPATIATAGWSGQQTAEFRETVTIAGLVLTVVAAALVGFGIVRSRPKPGGPGFLQRPDQARRVPRPLVPHAVDEQRRRRVRGPSPRRPRRRPHPVQHLRRMHPHVLVELLDVAPADTA